VPLKINEAAKYSPGKVVILGSKSNI